MTEALVKWKALPVGENTWVNCEDLQMHFPELQLEDKLTNEARNDMNWPIIGQPIPRRSLRFGNVNARRASGPPESASSGVGVGSSVKG